MVQVKVPISKQKLQDIFISLDDIDSLSKTKKIKKIFPKPIDELNFKKGIQKIIDEKGKFQDWGGEKMIVFYKTNCFRKKKKNCICL